MVDEKLLHDVRECLERIEMIRNYPDLEIKFKEKGFDITVMSSEDITNVIVIHFLNDRDRLLYNKYAEFIKREKYAKLVSAIDSLNTLTTNVDSLYDERKEYFNQISSIKSVLEKIRRKLFDLPRVRISSLYSHLEYDYNKYSKKVIEVGMKESKLNDRIHGLKSGGMLFARIRQKELGKVKAELAAYKSSSEIQIDERKQKYIRTREEYTELLRTVINELFRDDLLLNAYMLSCHRLYNLDMDISYNNKGVAVVSKKDKEEISRKLLIDYFFEYFEDNCDEKYDAEIFCNLLTKFIMHYYVVDISRLEVKRDKCLSDIRSSFEAQKSVLGNVSLEEIGLGYNEDYSKDDEDTLMLVHSKINK